MDDSKTFGRLLLALYTREFEGDKDVTVSYINESLFDDKLEEAGLNLNFCYA